MDRAELRLECLRLAAAYCPGSHHPDAVHAAKDFIAFVEGRDGDAEIVAAARVLAEKVRG
jgi:putative intracellular protease/amidase